MKHCFKEDIITKIRYSFSCFGDYTKNEGFVIDIVSKDKVRIEYQSYSMADSIQPVVVYSYLPKSKGKFIKEAYRHVWTALIFASKDDKSDSKDVNFDSNVIVF